MYFRRIVSEHIEYYATNSSGNFAALARKMDESNDKSWSVFSGEKDSDPSLSDSTLEEAFDHILLNFSQSADQKQAKKTKKAKAK